MIRSISDIVASNHVPPLYNEHFPTEADVSTEEGILLINSGKTLVTLIGEKEAVSGELETRLSKMRSQINRLYYCLDERIATVLAVAQLDQVMGENSSDQNSLAPYVLKSLNQLTLVALNSLIAREYSDREEGIVVRNRQFLFSQLHTIDHDGNITSLFEELFREIESLENIITTSNRTLNDYDVRIAEAKLAFDQAISGTGIESQVTKAQYEVQQANAVLARASKRTLITTIIFLFVLPGLVVFIGIYGLNSVVIGPITSLVEAMRDVESGSFDVKAPVKTNDEIGQLAKAFNAMAGEIKSKVNEMSILNQTLKKSESKYRTLVDNLPQSIFLKNGDLVYVSCNRNYALSLGLTEPEVAGKTDYDFFPPDLAEKYRNDDKRIMLTGKTEDMEESFVLDSTEQIVQTVKTPIRDDYGNISGVLGIFWDITERKRDEEQLYLARFSLENAPLFTFWLDMNGRMKYVNENACKNPGYSRDELLAMHIWEIEPTLSPKRFAQLWSTMHDGAPIHANVMNRRKNGSVFPVEVFSRQVEYKGTRYNLAFVNDLTDRKQLENQLLQAQKMEAIGTMAGRHCPRLQQPPPGHQRIHPGPCPAQGGGPPRFGEPDGYSKGGGSRLRPGPTTSPVRAQSGHGTKTGRA